jgi:hypothetical protein
MTALVKPHQKGHAQPANAVVATSRRYDAYGNKANFIRPQWGTSYGVTAGIQAVSHRSNSGTAYGSNSVGNR